GNVIDPLEMIDEIGADALRFALTVGTAPASDQQLTDAKLDGARNFSNKLWNAARFVLGARPDELAEPYGDANLPERWIRSRLAEATARATRQLDGLDLGGYTAGIYDFAWSDYCDWFVEMAKVDLRRPDALPGEQARVWRTAADCLAGMLRLLHPIMPFITEQVWATLHEVEPRATNGEPLLIVAAWPADGGRDEASEVEMSDLAELVRGVRNLRTEARLPAGAWLPLAVVPADAASRAVLERSAPYISALARVRPIDLRDSADVGEQGSLVTAVRLGTAWLEAPAPSGGTDARGEARARLLARIERLRGLLANAGFVERAPAAVVARERERLAELEEQLRRL
ncbi:MAG TPA: class I tRNA ligase family protein, partial [Candidatus Dormibacteraeota bacterium]|nr:class I tRNA ligase family protein [Candidatus Dormibacteraeota bacterium]